jgi:anthranilate phosphoribosyltransferase
VLYTLIDDEQQEALRVLAFMRQSAIADIVREAIDHYLASKGPTQEEIDGVVKLVRKSVRNRVP